MHILFFFCTVPLMLFILCTQIVTKLDKFFCFCYPRAIKKEGVSLKRIFAYLLLICIFLSLSLSVSAYAALSFSDVMTNDWFYSSVNFVTQNGMFNGTGANTFSPNSSMTRGMFVTVLGRYGGAPSVDSGSSMGIITKSDVNMRTSPTTSGSSVLACLSANTQVEVLSSVPDAKDPSYTWYYIKYNGMRGYIRNDLMKVLDGGFSDVSVTAYYSSYVQWAYAAGIAEATGSGTFSPDRDITREEICAMLYNFANYKNIQLKPTVNAQSFIDSSSIKPSYAAAVSTLQQIGVINGYSDGSFRPKGNATRAEVASMLMRFVDAISYHPSTEPSIDASGNYIFGTEVPVSPSVGASYFSDACFIGHSLVVGMRNYFGLTNADYFAVNGASAKYLLNYDGFELTTTHTNDEGIVVPDTGTLKQAISQKQYGKVYIMLGVNEIGSASYHQQSFYSNMSSLIAAVQELQPNAKIYLISLTPVSQSCSESRDDVNRDNIINFNKVIKQLCADKHAYYLNAFDLLANSNGYLSDDACATDGIHILAPQYKILKNYICSHVAS